MRPRWAAVSPVALPEVQGLMSSRGEGIGVCLSRLPLTAHVPPLEHGTVDGAGRRGRPSLDAGVLELTCLWLLEESYVQLLDECRRGARWPSEEEPQQAPPPSGRQGRGGGGPRAGTRDQAVRRVTDSLLAPGAAAWAGVHAGLLAAVAARQFPVAQALLHRLGAEAAAVAASAAGCGVVDGVLPGAGVWLHLLKLGDHAPLARMAGLALRS